jgi:hypothetical protein
MADNDVVTFSQPVMSGRYSFITHPDLGEYPEVTGDPFFPDLQTCTLPVKLEPGKTYAIGINGPDHKNFQPGRRNALSRALHTHFLDRTVGRNAIPAT